MISSNDSIAFFFITAFIHRTHTIFSINSRNTLMLFKSFHLVLRHTITYFKTITKSHHCTSVAHTSCSLKQFNGF